MLWLILRHGHGHRGHDIPIHGNSARAHEHLLLLGVGDRYGRLSVTWGELLLLLTVTWGKLLLLLTVAWRKRLGIPRRRQPLLGRSGSPSREHLYASLVI